jgi:hypothetical protein
MTNTTPKKAVATPEAQSCFSRKIGNTTFVVSVAFSEKTTESVEDKILRLVANDLSQNEEVHVCS